MSRRTQRVGSLIRSTIAELIPAKLADPRIDPVRTTITRVEVPEDLLTAKVFVSVLGSEGKQKKTLHGLRNSAGRLQDLMMRKIKLRNTPKLEFVLDTNYKKTLETLEIIQQVSQEIREKDLAAQEQAEEGENSDSDKE